MSDLKSVIQNEIEHRKEMKNSNFSGAAIGAGVAVGLELISSKGGIGSAVAAGVVGGYVACKMKDVLDAIDEDKAVKIGAGSITFLAGSTAGSIWRSYFPNGEADSKDY